MKSNYEEKLSALYDLAKEMTLTRNIDKISKIVLDAAEKILEFEYIDLILIDEEKENLQLIASRGWEDRKVYNLSLSSKKGITVHVAKTGDSLNIPDVKKDERYLMASKKIRSELCVPLKVRGKVIGIIDAENTNLDAFSEEDQQLLEILASQAAAAIENARLYEYIENQRKESSEFAHTVSHDLKNYIGTIKNRAQLSLKKEETAKNNAEKIVEITEQMERFVSRQLELADAGKAVGEPKEVDLNELLDEIGEEHELTVEREDLPTIEGDPQRLREVFHNLIENAVIHGEATRVKADSEKKDDTYVISVKDNGKGIAEEFLDNIFNMGYSTDGTGFGLSIVKRIVEAHEGSISVDSEEGEKTTFTLMFPR